MEFSAYISSKCNKKYVRERTPRIIFTINNDCKEATGRFDGQGLVASVLEGLQTGTTGYRLIDSP